MSTTMVNRPRALLLLAPLALAACADPPVYLPPNQVGGPAGVIDGTLTYAGPPPCTEGGYIVGAGVIEIFDQRLLPPPEGLGTTAASLAVVPGDVLFDGIRAQLTFRDDGALWCPDAAAKPVTVSASWAGGPLGAGVYQVRGFYDYDGDFDPVLSIYKVPSRGDVGGGAIENGAEVLQGKPPVYRAITVGDLQDDGSYAMPELGARVSGVAVTFALQLPLEAPIFHAKAVAYSDSKCKGGQIVAQTPANSDPTKVTMPSDYLLPSFAAADPAATEKSLIRVTLGAGVLASEVDTAAGPPFALPVKSPAPFFQVGWQDVNGDGVLGDGTGLPGGVGEDHVPDSTSIPSLFPLAIFNKLDAPNGEVNKLLAQASPVIILQGLTIYKGLLATASTKADLSDQVDEITVGLRPAVLCIDPVDATKPATLLVTHKTDCGDVHDVISSEAATKKALKRQFGREVEIVEGCLPEGSYALNLIYGTGQAWTVPNEAGVCQPQEDALAAQGKADPEGKICGDLSTEMHRPVIASQSVVVTIGKPDDASWCQAHPTPAACLPPTK